MHFYSEFEPSAAQWLRNLADAGEIPHGYVDDRDMREIGPGELSGYTQCHFFAGIGGWPLALRLAGWPEDCEVWTGSCPCQPFSNAGKRLGTADERHLWPTFAALIDEYRPPIVFGEQVASRDGRDWLARVRIDLERMGYAVGAADLCAAGFGAPHIRQRLYFGAIRMEHADNDGRQAGREAAAAMGYRRPAYATSRLGGDGMGYADSGRCEGRQGHAEHDGTPRGRPKGQRLVEGASKSHGRMADSNGARLARSARIEGYAIPRLTPVERNDPWRDAAWLQCRDGKARRVKSGVRLLADGLPRDVAPILSGYGNAIVPPLAAQFIRSFVAAVNDA